MPHNNPFWRALVVAALVFLSSQSMAGVIIDGPARPGPQRPAPNATLQPPARVLSDATAQQKPPAEATADAVAAARQQAKVVLPPAAIARPAHLNLSLTQAVRLIVPPDWKGYARDARISRLTNLEWRPKDNPWPAELEAVLDRTGIVASLNWTQKEVEFRIADSAAFKRFTQGGKR